MMWNSLWLKVSAVWCVLVVPASALQAAEQWGDLKGQIIYDGDPPAAAPLQITKDREECCKHNLVDESLVVNPRNHGLKNVLVYLYADRGDQVPVHPDYTLAGKLEQKLDNKGCRFDPRVVLLRTKQTLLIGNSDPIGHNVKIDTRQRDNPPSNDTIPAGGSLEKTFKVAERLPVPVSCSIHPWMQGWLVIRDTPYMAVTDEQGKFEIAKLPVGTWRFMFWQEAAGYVREVTVGGKLQKWDRGITQIDIRPGAADLGQIVVKPDLFQVRR